MAARFPEEHNLSSPESETELEFIDKTNEDKFLCLICSKIIINFIELPCSHVGCKYCIEQCEK